MFRPQLTQLKRVLCLGAHSDDIEIGCGGTMQRLIAENPGLDVRWVVFSGGKVKGVGDREAEARNAAGLFLEGAGSARVDVLNFKDRLFPTQYAELKKAFEPIKAFEPDLVFTHRLDDAHQDHRALAELTWGAFRDHWILAYEIPKFEGDLGHPNVFVGLADEVIDRKCALLDECFASQRSKAWFDSETFRGLARIRGLETGASTEKYAEAFYSRKLVL